MNAAAEPASSPQRDWWLRALAVFQTPRAVFAAIRDDSAESAQARAEPITAIILLAGIAGVLSTTIAGRLLDDPTFDGLSVAVWAFLGGGIYGLSVYWLGGALLHGSSSLLGSRGDYRRSRHVLGFAAAPLAVSLLLVWPARLAVYGGDVFRTGGDDTGAGDVLFEGLVLGFAGWALVLLVIGMRAVHGWSVARAIAAVALGAAPVALVVSLSLL
ncbi:MAG: Yip1 family protein [Gaiellaceae bacterium]